MSLALWNSEKEALWKRIDIELLAVLKAMYNYREDRKMLDRFGGQSIQILHYLIPNEANSLSNVMLAWILAPVI